MKKNRRYDSDARVNQNSHPSIFWIYTEAW